MPAKFAKTYCSNCGGEFGPGDHGFSHCDQHRSGRPAVFLTQSDYVETCSDLEKLRTYRAALVHAYSLAQGVAHIKSVDAAGIIDEISSVDYAVRELTDKLNAFDAGQDWYAGRAVKVA